MNPRTTLQERYPEADFSIYFRFLDACRDTEKGLDTQEHHICPRKQFPEFIDEAENLMTLRIDDHDFAHKLLEAACGIKAPHTAFLEAQRESASRAAALGGRKGGHNGGSNSYARRTGVHGRSAEKMSKDGRKAALVMVEKKLGIFAPEMLGVGGRIAGKIKSSEYSHSHMKSIEKLDSLLRASVGTSTATSSLLPVLCVFNEQKTSSIK
jgi:hypothetical protein